MAKNDANAPTIAFAGIACLDIDVQVQICAGFVGFTVVGLPDKAAAGDHNLLMSCSIMPLIVQQPPLQGGLRQP